MSRQIIKNNSGQINMSFAWIFAIVVGIIILSIAIYAATKIINTGGETAAAQAGKETGILLNALETGVEESQITKLTMPIDTRIYNKCSDKGTFGVQKIQLSQRNLNKWTETDFDSTFENKYIFSEEVVEGKDFLLFSKPFKFPFKIADPVYLTSSEKSYCFVRAPGRIREELEYLNQQNIFLENCPENSVKVGFSDLSDSCDAVVNENLGSVVKTQNNERVYFETDALMYAAIFSEKDVYECHVKRLMQRQEELLFLYSSKEATLQSQGCFVGVNLVSLRSRINDFESSGDLNLIWKEARQVDQENKLANCRLW